MALSRGSSEHVLADGTRVEIRPIRPEDKHELERAFARLSPASRYRRFFSQASELSPELLRYLTEVDGENHVALVACTSSHDLKSDIGLGVARFFRLPEPGGMAEAAITVIDEAQGRGLGRILLEELAAAARACKIRCFRAEVLVENQPMRHLLAESGAKICACEGETVLVEVPLGPPPANAEEQRASVMSSLLRAFAKARSFR